MRAPPDRTDGSGGNLRTLAAASGWFGVSWFLLRGAVWECNVGKVGLAGAGVEDGNTRCLQGEDNERGQDSRWEFKLRGKKVELYR